MPPVPDLPEDRCQVWWAGPADARDAHLALLDPVERARLAALHRQVDQDRFLVGAALLRLVLAGHTGADPAALAIDRSCPHCDRMHGRPRLAGGGPAVSISHGGDRVSVACARLPAVGVDVERVNETTPVDDLADQILAPRERRRPDRAGFFAYWTRKEAVLKATGDGLRVPMTQVTVTAPDEPPAVLAFAPRPELAGRFTMAVLHPGGGHAAALAVLRRDDRPLPAGWVTEHNGRDLLEPIA